MSHRSSDQIIQFLRDPGSDVLKLVGDPFVDRRHLEGFLRAKKATL